MQEILPRILCQKLGSLGFRNKSLGLTIVVYKYINICTSIVQSKKSLQKESILLFQNTDQTSKLQTTRDNRADLAEAQKKTNCKLRQTNLFNNRLLLCRVDLNSYALFILKGYLKGLKKMHSYCKKKINKSNYRTTFHQVKDRERERRVRAVLVYLQIEAKSHSQN